MFRLIPGTDSTCYCGRQIEQPCPCTLMKMKNKKTLKFWPDGLMPLPNVVSAFHSSVKDIEHIVGMAYLLLGTVKTEERLASDVISNIQHHRRRQSLHRAQERQLRSSRMHGRSCAARRCAFALKAALSIQGAFGIPRPCASRDATLCICVDAIQCTFFRGFPFGAVMVASGVCTLHACMSEF